MEEKRITWEKEGASWCAYNDNDEWLGCLSYEKVGKHMHCFWHQDDDIRMSPGCLQEVRDKQVELFNLKRKKNKNEN